MSEASAWLEDLDRTRSPAGGSPLQAFYLISNLQQMTCAEHGLQKEEGGGGEAAGRLGRHGKVRATCHSGQ